MDHRHIPSTRLFSILTLYTVGAIALTWPLTPNIGTHLPLGTETSATVPLFNLWSLEWHSYQASVGYASYWQAPIFYPTQGAFAFSEHHLLLGGPYTLLRWLTGNAVAAYNLMLLGIITLNGASAYHMALRVSSRFEAALAIGWLAQTLPFAHHELGVLQLTVLFPLFFALAAFYQLRQVPNAEYMFGLAFWCVVTFLTSGYYGVFLGVLMAMGAITLLLTQPKAPIRLVPFVAAGTLAVGSVLPVILAQRAYTDGFNRSEATIERGSAALVDYTERHPATFGAVERGEGSIQHLYPGTAVLIVGVLGLAAAPREWAALCAVWVVSATLLSLGLNVSLFGWQPYRLFIEFIPGFDLLRSPFRAGVFLPLGLLACGGPGLSWLLDRMERCAGLASLVIIAIVALDGVILPTRLTPYPAQDEGWVEWLGDQPSRVVIAHVPFPASGHTADFEPTVGHMLHGLEHGRSMVNGYSGFFPPTYRLLADSMEGFPNAFSTSRLVRTGVAYVVIDAEWLTSPRQNTLQALGYERVFTGEGKVIYTLP